jgi:hypothetical protein
VGEVGELAEGPELVEDPEPVEGPKIPSEAEGSLPKG